MVKEDMHPYAAAIFKNISPTHLQVVQQSGGDRHFVDAGQGENLVSGAASDVGAWFYVYVSVHVYVYVCMCMCKRELCGA